MATELAHARLCPPSSSDRWRPCAASAVINVPEYDLSVPEIPHPMSVRGTLMHGVHEDLLADWIFDGIEMDAHAFIGRKHEGQIFGKLEAVEIQRAVDYVKKRASQDPETMIFFEQRLYFNRLVGLDDPNDAFGSGDVIMIQPRLRKQITYDLKTGKWEVEPEYNNQLTIYSASAHRKYSMLAETPNVEIIIYQRKPNIWEISDVYLKSFVTSLRRDVRKVVEAERAFKKTGQIPAMYYQAGDHCRFCKARTCEKRGNF